MKPKSVLRVIVGQKAISKGAIKDFPKAIAYLPVYANVEDAESEGFSDYEEALVSNKKREAKWLISSATKS